MNAIALDGRIESSEEPRFTPSGLQVFEGTLRHTSEVLEAGGIRKLDFATSVTAYGEVAKRLQALPFDRMITARGYVAPRSRRTQRLTVYITEFS